MALEKAVRVDDLPPGTMVAVRVAGEELLVVNVDGSFYAVDDVCLHMGGPLHEGTLERTTVTCPWHDGRYNVRTGVADPETEWVTDTRTFPTEVRDGFVWVEV